MARRSDGTEPFQISHVLLLKAQQRQLRAALGTLEGRQAFQQLSSVGLAPNTLQNMEGQGTVRYGRVPDGSITAGTVLGVDAPLRSRKGQQGWHDIREQATKYANQTRDVVISDTYLFARLATEACQGFGHHVIGEYFDGINYWHQ